MQPSWVEAQAYTPGMQPHEVEALGRMTASELAACHVEAADIRPPDPAPSGAGGRQAETPLLTGGEIQKPALRGKSVQIPDFEGYSESLVMDRKGNPVIRPGVRCIKGQKVGIDWVSAVFEPKEAWMYSFVAEISDSEHFASEDYRVANFVKKIIGWLLGISPKDSETHKYKIYSNGLNGYKFAIGLPFSAGIIHVGHSSGTCLVTISGQGCLVAEPGWEHRFYRFLVDVRGWLTRIDMAFDDYEGKLFPVREMRKQAREGAFDRRRPPKIELRGAWEQNDPDNTGLTLYIGARMSGKLCRIYEKGKQLGDETSEWVRAEVELHNSCYQLTLDMLLKPSQWFAAFYPVFESIQFAGPRVDLEYRQRIAEKTIAHSFKWIRHQAGGHLAGLRQLYTDSEILDLLQRPESIPEAFIVSEKSLQSLLAPSVSRTDEPGFISA